MIERRLQQLQVREEAGLAWVVGGSRKERASQEPGTALYRWNPQELEMGWRGPTERENHGESQVTLQTDVLGIEVPGAAEP